MQIHAESTVILPQIQFAILAYCVNVVRPQCGHVAEQTCVTVAAAEAIRRAHLSGRQKQRPVHTAVRMKCAPHEHVVDVVERQHEQIVVVDVQLRLDGLEQRKAGRTPQHVDVHILGIAIFGRQSGRFVSGPR